MAKHILFDYTFDPANKTLTFSDTYDQKRFLIMTNVTTGDIIYNFADSNLGGTFEYFYEPTPSTIVTLTYDTTSMSSSDSIQIFYDADKATFAPADEYLDPVSKIRVSNPENLIDTDFEYGLQSTKWETIELTNNIPTFFTRNGDQSINLTSVDVNSGSTLVKVSTELDHNLLRGSPIYIKGTNSILADGGFIVKNVIDEYTFTYEGKGTFSFTGSIKDTYTELFSAAIYDGTEFKLENTGAIETDEGSPSSLTANTQFPVNFKAGTSLALTNSFAKATIQFDTDDVLIQNQNINNVDITENDPSLNPDSWGILGVDKHGWEPVYGSFKFDPADIIVDTNTNTITFPTEVPDNYYHGYTQSNIDNNPLGLQQPIGFVYVSDPTNTPIGGLVNGACYWMYKTGTYTARLYNQKSTSLTYLVNLTSAGASGGITKDAFVFGISVTYNFNNGNNDYVQVYRDSIPAVALGFEQGLATSPVSYVPSGGYNSFFSNPTYQSPWDASWGWNNSTYPEVHPQYHTGSSATALRSSYSPRSYVWDSIRDYMYFRYTTSSWWGGSTTTTINALNASSSTDWVFLPRSGQTIGGYTIYKENHGLETYDQINYTRTNGTLFTNRNNPSSLDTYVGAEYLGVVKSDENSFKITTAYWGSNPFYSENFYPSLDAQGQLNVRLQNIKQATVTGSNRISIAGEALNDGDTVTYSKGDVANTAIGGITDGGSYFVAAKTDDAFSLSTTKEYEDGSDILIVNPHTSNVVDITNNTITATTFANGVFTNGDAIIHKGRYPNSNFGESTLISQVIGGLNHNGVYYVRVIDDPTGEIRLYPTKADALADTNPVNLRRVSPSSGSISVQKINIEDFTSVPSTNEQHQIIADFVGAADGNYTLSSVATDQKSFSMTNATKVETRTLNVKTAESFVVDDSKFRVESHGFLTGQEVEVTVNGTTNITNLSSGTYYIISNNRNTFQFAATKADADSGTEILMTEVGALTSFSTASIDIKSNDVVGRFDSNGTVSGEANQKHLQGEGTSFTSFFQKGDTIYIENAEQITDNNISSVSSGNLVLSAGVSSADTGKAILVNGTNLSSTNIYFMRYVSSTTISLHPTRTDANANTNIIAATSSSQGAKVSILEAYESWIEVEVDNVNDDSSIELVDDLPVQLTAARYSQQTKLLLRPDGFALHRPYDGGVELIAPTNPDSQMIRQTRKYFRYQSGKGIQVSFAVNFSPSTQIDTFTRNGTTATITTRYPHRLSPNLGITTFGATNAKETLPTENIEVTLLNIDGQNRFYFDGERPTDLVLYEGRTYRFDMSSVVLSGHHLKFSTTQDGIHNAVPGTEYTTGVTTSGTAGTAGAYVEIVVPTNAPTLYSYCGTTGHANYGTKHSTPVDPDNNQGILWNTKAIITGCPTPTSATLELDQAPFDPSAKGTPEYYVNTWQDCTLRCGLFDDQNGLFFEYDGTDIWAVIRNSTKQLRGTVEVNFRSGQVNGTNTAFATELSVDDFVVIKGQSYRVVRIESDATFYIAPSYRGVSKNNVIISRTVENRVKQSDWNIDKADGTGKSGFKLDIHKIQMAYIDYSWYGAGKVRFGFKDQNGNVKYVHSFAHGNYKTEAYMRSGNMPARYELFNKDAPNYTPALAHWGTSVIMDGRFDPDKAYLFNAKSQSIVVTGEASVTVNGRVETVNKYIRNRGWGTDTYLGYALLLQNPQQSAATQASGQPIAGAGLNAGTKLALPSDLDYSSPYIQQVNAYIENEEKKQDSSNRTLLVLDQAPATVNGTFSSYTLGNSAADISVVDNIPLISIRLSPSVDTSAPGFLGEREIINRMQLILSQVSVLSTHSLSISLLLNGKLSTTSWQRVDNPSLSQLIYHQFGDTITEGQSVYNFEAQGGTGSTGRQAVLTEQDLGEIATLGNSILGGNNTFPDGPDVLTVVAKLNEDINTVSASNPFVASSRITWSESQA